MKTGTKIFLIALASAVVVGLLVFAGTVWYYESQESEGATNSVDNSSDDDSSDDSASNSDTVDNTTTSSDSDDDEDDLGTYNTKDYDYDVLLLESFPVQVNLSRTNTSSGKKETFMNDAEIRKAIPELKANDKLILVELSEPKESKFVYYLSALANSGDPGQTLYEFNTEDESFRKMKLSSEVSTLGGFLGGREASPSGELVAYIPPTDGTKVQAMHLLNLTTDTAKKILTLSGKESLNGGNGGLGMYTELEWRSETKLEYGVFDSTMEIEPDPSTGQSFKRIAMRTLTIE